eukprot:TRINITY_DN4120_c0_g1_i1.p2 TRINITY_DN4120_c0_g1~~TRINITY_DN4120_c0_g1_i1.p2  ORF type:complete len:304 (+),score=61.64 TRINITY_DN4120_c0_g1_i1:120-1031(+)
MGDTLTRPITDKYSTILENEMLTVGATGMQGWRKGMEDAHATVLKLDGCDAGPCSFFGVYDGHCGQATAKYTGDNLHKQLALCDEFKNSQWPEAMKKAFLTVDDMLQRDGCDSSGCTAVTCLLTPEGKIVVGNAGDSRCVLCRAGKAVPLSFDHKPTNEEEIRRIQAAGGTVSGGRVQGNLALSRAIGDFEFKQSKTLPPEEQIVTANPDVTITDITPEDEFIVLACDGIWDVMTNDEVIDFVSQKINHNDVAKVCEDTCDRCLAPSSPGLGCDNMTMMVIQLKDKLRGKLARVSKPSSASLE